MSDGDPLVLLHGFSGSHRSWDAVADALSGARRIIAVDLPGHGDSDFGTDIETYSIEHTAGAVEAGLTALGVSAGTLLGYSMGGRLALYVAVTRPRRVRRLILESGGPGLRTEEERTARRRADEELAQFAITYGIAAFVERWQSAPVLSEERRLPAPTREQLRAQRLSCSVAGLAASLRGMGTGSQPWLGDRLHAVEAPVLLVAGADDQKFVAIAGSMVRGLRHARLEVVPGAGHNIHLERPQEFARLVDEFVAHEAGGRES